MSDTPQHDKLKEIQPLSQAIGEFLDWASERGWRLAEWEKDRVWDDRMYPIQLGTTDLLALHFGIDLNALEDEKRTMLEQIRAAQ